VTPANDKQSDDIVRRAFERLLLDQSDPMAWQAFLALTWPFVRAVSDRVASRLSGSLIDADTLSQEAFATFASKLKAGGFTLPPDAQDGSAWIKQWLFRQVMRTCNTEVRRELRRRKLLPRVIQRRQRMEAAEPTVGELAEYHELLRRLDDELSMRGRNILRLLLEGHTQVEVALICRCSVKTVQRTLHQIRGLLQRVLGGEKDGP
jgi:RNA polymerase sigma factor (sigma-70 family)